MALIPTDIGLRLRIPSDSGVSPTTPVTGIPSDLPDLQPGQVFSAKIQEVLPESTYRALVAGKSITLALPEGAKPGDTLELVVVDRTAKAILAKPAGLESGLAEGEFSSGKTMLSPAGQLIGKLLNNAASTGTSPTITANQPVLNAPPNSAATLAPALAKAIEQSGLFYESHQAEWVAGKRPLSSLLQEPQGQWSRPEAFLAARETEQSSTALTRNANEASTRIDTKQAELAAQENSSTPQASNKSDVQHIPDDIRPLVQQQLELADAQRLVWHGEVWPGQTMDWEIEQEAPERKASGEESDPAWNTTLKLSTPRLGSVEARLRLSGSTLQLNISTPFGATAADLRDELPALSATMAAAGIKLENAQVRHDTDEAA